MKKIAIVFNNKQFNYDFCFNNWNFLHYFSILSSVYQVMINVTFDLFLDGKRSFDDDVIWDNDSDSSTDDESDTTLAITDKVDCTTLVLK